MCYSAQIKADYARFVREYGAKLSIKAFYDLFWRRLTDRKIQVPRGVEAAFESPSTDEQREVRALIGQHAAAHAEELRQELARQQERLANADLKLASKPTKTAENERRIARNKIGALEDRLAQLQRTELDASDLRIFPGTFVPVMVMQEGERFFLPMRYQCRPSHVPAKFDVQYPGTYNARRDALRSFWRNLYGVFHGVVILSAFYEHVPRHLAEGRALAPGEPTSSTQVEFRPEPAQDLLAACIWSRWSGPGEPDLLSFALITHDPPPEVAAVGHDRCIVPIRPEDLDAWLQPSARDLATQDAILDRAMRPYFAHHLVGTSKAPPG